MRATSRVSPAYRPATDVRGLDDGSPSGSPARPSSGGVVVREDMVNGWAVCHGGVVATLADSCFAVACNSRGTVTVASGFEVSFLESARLGEELVATGREVALRGRSGLYDVEVRRADGTLVAAFRGRSRSLGTPNPALPAAT